MLIERACEFSPSLRVLLGALVAAFVPAILVAARQRIIQVTSIELPLRPSRRPFGLPVATRTLASNTATGRRVARRASCLVSIRRDGKLLVEPFVERSHYQRNTFRLLFLKKLLWRQAVLYLVALAMAGS